MTDTTILTASKISKTFKQKEVLRDLDFNLSENQIVAICGTNGSGKSVFMRVLAGLVLPDNGSVTIFGTTLDRKNEFPVNTGVHFDNSGLLLTETARNNLLLLAMVSNTISKERIDEVIRLVGLEPMDKRPVRTYSTGMRQRLGIAQRCGRRLRRDVGISGLGKARQHHAGGEGCGRTLDELASGAVMVVGMHGKSCSVLRRWPSIGRGSR